MGTRIAAFGGVYSNEPALRAVLAAIVRSGADAVHCLGDLGGFGPYPDRAADLLRAADVPMLRGNYDDAIGSDRRDCDCGYTDPRDNHYAQIAFDYTAARTAPRHKAWMRDLPEQRRFAVEGKRVLLCHGSPRRVNEFLWESTCPDAFLERLCQEFDADVILCTHTGIPWHVALPSGRHVVNVGAVGRPANDGRPAAWWAWVEIGDRVAVVLEAVAYDHEAVAREVVAEGLPPEFAETLRTGWWTTCLENLPAKERRRGRF